MATDERGDAAETQQQRNMQVLVHEGEICADLADLKSEGDSSPESSPEFRSVDPCDSGPASLVMVQLAAHPMIETSPVSFSTSLLNSTTSAGSKDYSKIQQEKLDKTTLRQGGDVDGAGLQQSERSCEKKSQWATGFLVIDTPPLGSSSHLPHFSDHTTIERELMGQGEEDKEDDSNSDWEGDEMCEQQDPVITMPKWMVKYNGKIFRALVATVLFLSTVLSAMNAIGQLEQELIVFDSNGVGLITILFVSPDITGKSIAFCALWGIVGCFQFHLFAVVSYRTFVKHGSRKWFVRRLPLAPRTIRKDCEDPAMGNQGTAKTTKTVVQNLEERLSVKGPWFWYVQSVSFTLAMFFQMEALSVNGGYSIAKRRAVLPVQEPPILIVHACIIGLLFATLPLCFFSNQRLLAVLFSTFCNIGFTLDRLMLISQAENKSWTSYWMFKQDSLPELISSLLPAFALWKGLRMVEQVLLLLEEQRGQTTMARLPKKEGRRGACSARSRRSWMRAAPFVLASTAFVAFTCRQVLWTDCSHLRDTCGWLVHPLWDFPACDCHVIVQPVFNATAMKCIDFKSDILALNASRVQWMFLGMTPPIPSAAACAVTDGPFYELLRAFPLLRGVGAPNNAIELADQASLPVSAEMRIMDLSFNPIASVSQHLRHRWNNFNAELNFEYTAIQHIDDDFAIGLDFRVRIYGTPICADENRIAELKSMYDTTKTDAWGAATGLDCYPIFADRGDHVNASQFDECFGLSALNEETMLILQAARSKCDVYKARPPSQQVRYQGHFCTDTCVSVLPFLSAIDMDDDGYLDFEEGAPMLPLILPAVTLGDETQYACVVAFTGCQDEDPEQSKMSIKSLMVFFTSSHNPDGASYTIGTDCALCT